MARTSSRRSRAAEVVVDGRALTPEQVESIADGARCSLSREAALRVHAYRRAVLAAMRGGKQVYGVNTGFGQLAQVAGQLVPDDVMVAIMREVLSSPAVAKGFILDGYPRTLPQARALTAIFEELNIRDCKVIEFQVEEEEIVRRVTSRLVCQEDGRIYNLETDTVVAGGPCPDCGARLVQRDDDKEATIRERLRVYRMNTSEVISYFDRCGLVYEVDGSASIDMVNREIKLILAEGA